jgi:DNA repair exonuclease SbcCD ATPase subunit
MIDSDLLQTFKRLKNTVLALEGERNLLQKQEKEIIDKIVFSEHEILLYENVRNLLELFVKSTEKGIKNYVEPLITEALEYVFSQYLKFHLILTTRRNQIEIDFVLIRSSDIEQLYQECIKDPSKEDDLMELVKDAKNINYNQGGAINQVISTVLRLVILEMLKIKGPVFFDEPTSMVSEEYSTRLGHLLLSLSRRFNRQHILITHSNSLAAYASKIYQVTQENSISRVTLINDGV